MFWEIIKKPLLVSLAIIGLVIAGFAYYGASDSENKYEFTTAKRGDVVREIGVTGRVKPSESADLAFETSGRIASVNVDVGDSVVAGQLMVRLENSDIRAQLAQAEAAVETAEAKLAELLRGTPEEEIDVQETKVQNAKTALEDEQQNIVDEINDAYTKADDAVRNKVDQFIDNPRSSNPQLSFSLSDTQLEIDIEQQRVAVESLLNSWNDSVNLLTTESDLESAIAEAKDNVATVKSFLNDVALAVNSLSSNSSLSQATIDGYKSDVSTARTNVNTAISNISSANEAWRSAQSSLAVEEQELKAKLAGTTIEEINTQEARIKEAKANAERFRAELAKTVIRAPINGVVTVQDAKRGEIISANTTVVSVISKSDFEIEANVPEADIAALNIGDKAEITLDAYGSDVVFPAVVVKIDPAETIVEGVATYKTTLQFLEKDERIKSGMTANIDIFADKQENVIVIPQRAVNQNDNGEFVRVRLADGTVAKRTVEIGLEGSDGTVEIRSGLQEGEEIVTFVREN